MSHPEVVVTDINNDNRCSRCGGIGNISIYADVEDCAPYRCNVGDLLGEMMCPVCEGAGVILR